VHGRRSTRSATLVQNGRSDIAQSQYRQISATIRARGAQALTESWLLYAPHALTRKIIGFAHMHIAKLEYETTTFIRNVGHHSLSGAKPHPVLDANSHAPTISNMPVV